MKRWQELEKATEDLLKLAKLDFIRVDNYICYKCHAVQNRKAKGWPDYFVYYPAVLAIECKTGKGKLTVDQDVIIKKLFAMDIKTLILYDTTDLLIEYLKQEGYL